MQNAQNLQKVSFGVILVIFRVGPLLPMGQLVRRVVRVLLRLRAAVPCRLLGQAVADLVVGIGFLLGKRKIVPTCNEDGDFEMLFIKDPTDQW